MSLTGFHPFWDAILSQNLQAVADQGCYLEGSSPYKGPPIGGYTVYTLSSSQNERPSIWDTLLEKPFSVQIGVGLVHDSAIIAQE
jgi:hypothetical protein